jgi:hypothetical protein
MLERRASRPLGAVISYSKTNAGTINVASFGVGTTSHLAGELFKAMGQLMVERYRINLQEPSFPATAILARVAACRRRYTNTTASATSNCASRSITDDGSLYHVGGNCWQDRQKKYDRYRARDDRKTVRRLLTYS